MMEKPSTTANSPQHTARRRSSVPGPAFQQSAGPKLAGCRARAHSSAQRCLVAWEDGWACVMPCWHVQTQVQSGIASCCWLLLRKWNCCSKVGRDAWKALGKAAEAGKASWDTVVDRTWAQRPLDTAPRAWNWLWCQYSCVWAELHLKRNEQY